MSAVDGTAVILLDYNVTTTNFTLVPGENATYEVDTIVDSNCEVEDEYFTLVIKDSSNAVLDTANGTANVTISSDSECGKTMHYVSLYLSTNPSTPLLRWSKIRGSDPFCMCRKYLILDVPRCTTPFIDCKHQISRADMIVASSNFRPDMVVAS